MSNTLSKMEVEDAQMRFDIKEGVTDCKTIKVLCSNADDNVCKEELTILFVWCQDIFFLYFQFLCHKWCVIERYD